MFKMFTTSLALTAFASLALAQNTVTVTETVTVSNAYTLYTSTAVSTYTTSSAAAPSPTSTGAATTHSIQVGPGGQLVYSPDSISANIGDTVEFFFNPKNHTVTQSSFADPCDILAGGLDSGFTNPTTVPLTSVGFSFVVNVSTPIWFYCRQTGHCKQGMVFAVNANANKTFAAFQANAMNSGSSSTTPSGSSGGSTGSAATGTDATATATGASASASSSSNGNNGFSTSANFGLTALVAVVGGIILAL